MSETKTLEEIEDSDKRACHIWENTITSDDCIICPWCGDVDEHPFDGGEPPGELDCMNCEKPFELSLEYTVTFNATRKAEGEDDE